MKLILFTSWMACLPHGFQFREQSREEKQKDKKIGLFFPPERALVKFFGKLLDAAMQANTPTPPPTPHPSTPAPPPVSARQTSSFFDPLFFLGLCYRGYRSAGRGRERERSSRLCRSHPTAPCLSRCHCDANEGRLLGRDRSCPRLRTMGAE